MLIFLLAQLCSRFSQEFSRGILPWVLDFCCTRLRLASYKPTWIRVGQIVSLPEEFKPTGLELRVRGNPALPPKTQYTCQVHLSHPLTGVKVYSLSHKCHVLLFPTTPHLAQFWLQPGRSSISLITFCGEESRHKVAVFVFIVTSSYRFKTAKSEIDTI